MVSISISASNDYENNHDKMIIAARSAPFLVVRFRSTMKAQFHEQNQYNFDFCKIGRA